MELVLLHGVLCDVRVEAREHLIATWHWSGGGGSGGGLCGEQAPPQQLLSSAARSDGLFLASGAETVALLLLRTMALVLPRGLLPTASQLLEVVLVVDRVVFLDISRGTAVRIRRIRPHLVTGHSSIKLQRLLAAASVLPALFPAFRPPCP